MAETKFAYPNIWQKAFLLEIVIPGVSPSEIFTFSLPPENIETVYTQRISETKTFGGVFFDDYGRDVAKITLSGNTGNSQMRRIYRGTGNDQWLNGKEEIYYIRDKIIRYKDDNKNYGDAKLYLYNLATIIESEISAGNYKAATDSWEVILKDFKVSQSKERPFWYSYTIEFTGVRILGQQKEASSAASITSGTSDPVSQLDEADMALAALEDPEEVVMIQEGLVPAQTMAKMHKIETNYIPASYHPSQPVESRLKLAIADGKLPATAIKELASLKTTTSKESTTSPTVVSWVSTAQLAVLNTQRAINKCSDIGKSREISKTILEQAGLFLRDAYSWSTKIAEPVRNARRQITKLKFQMLAYKSLVTGTINNTLFSVPLEAIRLIRNVEDLGVGIVTTPADIASDVISQFRQVRHGVEAIFNDIKYGVAPAFVKTKYAQVIENFRAETETCLNTAENKVFAVTADSKRPSITPDVLVVPAKANGDSPRTVLAYGYEYVVSPPDATLDTLAAKYLGNADDGILIALASGISEESDIQPGTILRIPVSKKTPIAGNEVFSRTDNFGVDIKLSESGGIAIDSSGGLSTISGSANISQAIQSRLSESIGNRIRLTVYGIKASVGQPISAASSYVATSIKDTVIHDPRIIRIENFVFRGIGDRLYVQFDYITVDGINGNYQGVA